MKAWVRLLVVLVGVHAASSIVSCSSSSFSGGGSKAKEKEKNGDKDAGDTDTDGTDAPDADGTDAPDAGQTEAADDADAGQTEAADTADQGSIDESVEEFTNGEGKIEETGDGVIKQKFTLKESNTPIDVVFVIDTSNSMQVEIDQVEANLGEFLTQLKADERSKFTQVMVLAGKANLTFTPPAALDSEPNFDFQGAGHKVDSWNGLAVARDFLNGTIAPNKLSPRAEAPKHLVFVTDDNAKTGNSVSPASIVEATFRTWLDENYPKPGSVTIHTISCPVKGGDCYDKSDAYRNLAADDKYKGVVEDLRSPDWGPILDAIVASIKAKAQYTYKLSKKAKADSVAVYKNGDKMADGFEFDEATNSVKIDQDKAAEGDILVITYSTK